jgi:hypothetical protein
MWRQHRTADYWRCILWHLHTRRPSHSLPLCMRGRAAGRGEAAHAIHTINVRNVHVLQPSKISSGRALEMLTASLMWIGIECKLALRPISTGASALWSKSHAWHGCGRRQPLCLQQHDHDSRRPPPIPLLSPYCRRAAKNCPPTSSPPPHHRSRLPWRCFSPPLRVPVPIQRPSYIVAHPQLHPREPPFSASCSRRTHAVDVSLAPPVHSPLAVIVARRRQPRSPPDEQPPIHRRISTTEHAP